MDTLSLTAKQILGIPVGEPERLFDRDEATRKSQRNQLAKNWHSDTHRGQSDCDAVLAHINALYDAAQAKDETGLWQTPGLMELRQKNGITYKRRYRVRHEIGQGVGEMFVGDTAITIRVGPGAKDLFDQAITTIGRFSYANNEMKERIAPFLPKIEKVLETDEGPAVVLTKTADLLLLKDVLQYFKGELPGRHVAWIINRLYNLACWLDWSGLTHNDISSDTVFISPQHHSAALLGGWMFAAPTGKKLTALPAHAATAAPSSMLAAKTASSRLDLILIKALGRELLGDRSGMFLEGRPNVPNPIAAFLRGSAGSDAPADYDRWRQTLEEAFGPRRFVELKLSASDLYNN